MARRILITGGGGFIGSHLAASHLASGDEVHILVRPDHRFRADRHHAGAVAHRIDLADRAATGAVLHRIGPEIVYHLATGTGREPVLPEAAAWPDLTEDLTNLLNLVLAAAEAGTVKALVRTGSLAEYGEAADRPDETQREAPLKAYTTAMTAGAHYCAMLQPQLPFPIVTGRLALTFGPGQSTRFLLPALIERCLAGEPIEIRFPDKRRDLIHVDDCVAGLCAMADHAVDGRLAGGTILNICTGQTFSVRDMAEAVLQATSASPSLIRYAAQSGDVRCVDTLGGSPERAASVLGWVATIPFVEGVTRTTQAMRQMEAA